MSFNCEHIEGGRTAAMKTLDQLMLGPSMCRKKSNQMFLMTSVQREQCEN